MLSEAAVGRAEEIALCTTTETRTLLLANEEAIREGLNGVNR